MNQEVPSSNLATAEKNLLVLLDKALYLRLPIMTASYCLIISMADALQILYTYIRYCNSLCMVEVINKSSTYRGFTIYPDHLSSIHGLLVKSQIQYKIHFSRQSYTKLIIVFIWDIVLRVKAVRIALSVSEPAQHLGYIVNPL